jgi:hypothetical protein
MRNDPPTTLRRVYGYHQARASGVGGVRADRSPRQVNRYWAERKEANENIEYVRQIVDADPEWLPFVLHWKGEGLTVAQIADSLHDAKYYMWHKSSFRTLKSHRPPF